LISLSARSEPVKRLKIKGTVYAIPEFISGDAIQSRNGDVIPCPRMVAGYHVPPDLLRD